MDSVIEITGLKKKYDNKFELGEINLDIPGGVIARINWRKWSW